MDWSSLIGLAIALIGIIAGQYLEGGKISSLLQPAAFLIVMLGTLGAVLLQTKVSLLVQGLKLGKQAFKPPIDDRKALAGKIVQWSNISRKDGVLKLEVHYLREQDAFSKKCLRLMIDGTPPEKIKEICYIDLDQYETAQRSAAKVWEAAGGYSPTVGILGAVLGLIHVMENLSDPSLLGAGIAVAFVATIYGVGLANLIFLPIAGKLKTIIQTEVHRREMIVDGLVSIANGDHPRVVQERINAFLR